jgi:hypothetical protein
MIPQEHLRLTDDEVPVSHDPQVVRPGELRAETEGRPVQGSDEDDAAAVHPQERLVQAGELDRRPQRRPPYQGSRTRVRPTLLAMRTTAEAPRRPSGGHRGTPFLQPGDVGVADEPLGVRSGEDDGVDVGVALDPVHQLLQLVGDVGAEQAVWAAVDPDGSAILDLEVALRIRHRMVCEFSKRSGQPSHGNIRRAVNQFLYGW